MKRILTVLLAVVLLDITVAAAGKKPVFLYSLYFNAPGENRYPADGNYREVLQRLSNDFEVHVSDKPLTPDNLKDVDLVLVANPNDQPARGNPPPHHVDEKDIAVITKYVEEGGGLIVMGNQENHNLETRDMNKLLARFGIQFTNVYTDAKKLVLPEDAPVIGGLRWAYYTGNQLVLDPSHAAKSAAVVTNDLKQKPAQGKRDAPGTLLASATPGKGRVLVATDSGWICDWAFQEKGVGGVALKGQDNWEIFHRLALWAVSREGSK